MILGAADEDAAPRCDSRSVVSFAVASFFFPPLRQQQELFFSRGGEPPFNSSWPGSSPPAA